jgi:hypothetical protein
VALLEPTPFAKREELFTQRLVNRVPEPARANELS